MPKKIPTARQQFKFKQAVSSDRQEDKNFYSSSAWRKLRAAHLKEFPLCARCRAKGFVNADSIQVHHIIDRKERPDLAYDRSNLESLCISCHSQETAKNNHRNNRY